MKLLLTDAGIRNPSIRAALLDLLGKPIEESAALAIPTAMYGHPEVGPGVPIYRFITGTGPNPMTNLGWKSVGVLELTALPSIDRDRWVPLVEAADILIAAGGDAGYLAYWMRQSGLADMLPSLKAVWLGLSGGSMALTPRIGAEFAGWKGPDGDRTLGIVDFSFCPHLAPDGMPGNSMADANAWAKQIPGRAYATDNDTAFKVVDGAMEIVSEGFWQRYQDGQIVETHGTLG